MLLQIKPLDPAAFGTELITAGLGGLPLSWSADGTLTGLDGLTASQRKRVAAVHAAHDPSRVPLAALKAEAHAVISAIANATTQLNLISAAAAIGAVPAGHRNAEEAAFLADFAQARAWIDAVRARVAELDQNGGATPPREARWPEPSKSVRKLVARF